MERLWGMARGQQRGAAFVRPPQHADPAVAPRLRRGPVDRVGAVRALGPERFELPARGASAADVLDQQAVAGCQQSPGVQPGSGGFAGTAVGGTANQRRQRNAGIRPIKVRPQYGAVPQRYLQVVFDHDAHQRILTGGIPPPDALRVPSSGAAGLPTTGLATILPGVNGATHEFPWGREESSSTFHTKESP
ncbi:hypothetical protein GCM10017744_008430 [Streptomyces antimycoticus]